MGKLVTQLLCRGSTGAATVRLTTPAAVGAGHLAANAWQLSADLDSCLRQETLEAFLTAGLDP